MSQLDLDSLDYALDDAAGLHQPAPGKATLTSRLARPATSGSGRIDADSHAHIESGLGLELSRPARPGSDRGDGGDGGGGGRGSVGGKRGLSFLGGGAEVGVDPGRAAMPVQGRGLEYLGDIGSAGFPIAAKQESSARPADDAVHALAVATTGGGSSLPGGLRGSLESATGADLGGVRVHTDEHAQAAASSINARAYAIGNDIHFGAGQYDPASSGGQHLIAHEVAHTIQQSSSPRAKAQGGEVSVSAPTDAFELEADRFADAFVGGSTAPITGGASSTTAFRKSETPPEGAKIGTKVGERGADGKIIHDGPPPASLAYSVKPPSAPVKPGDPGPNVKAPPVPLPGQPLTAKGAAKDGGKDAKGAAKDAKGAKDGGKGDKDGAKGDVKGDASAATKPAKHAPPPPPPAAPMAMTAPPVQRQAPVVMDDLGAVSEHEIKQWTAKTGRGPADHRAEIEAILSTLNSEITAKQEELANLGRELKAQQEAVSTARIATFEAKIAAGKGTVTGAFDKITTGLTPLATKAKAAVETSRLECETKLKTAESTKKGELTAAFTAANTAVTNLSTQQSGPYEAILTGFSKKLSEAGETTKGDVDKASSKIVKDNPPQECAGMGVMAARESLKASIKQESAKTVGKDAKKKIDGIIKPAAADINGKAKKTVEELIKPYKDTLDAEVKKTQTAADTNFAAAMKTAKDQLTAGAGEANAAIDKAVSTTKGNIENEKKTSLGIIDGAAKTATGEVKNASQEMATRIETKAAKDANELGALLGEARGLTRGKRVNADKIKPKLDDILADATAMHAAAVAGLNEMGAKGKTELDAVIVKQEGIFTTAVTEQTTQATEVETKSQQEINTAAEGFATTNTRTVTSFEETAGKDVAKVTGATATFNATATAGLKEQQEVVRSKLETVVLEESKKQLGEIAKTIEPETEKAAGPATEQKQKGVGGKATALRAAMDGWGTDESKIFAQLRDASYGEIELIEATYDEHYSHRASKGMTPLRYDLWDEMSGNELKIAQAYLDHNRDVAIKLELQDCCGWNDDEERIEAILRSASDDELKTLATKEKATLDLVRDNLSGCDLDTVDALVNTDMDRERRLLKADAIRVFDAMEGLGTDEAKVKQLLEQADTPEKRAMLREEFNAYAKKEGWGVAPKRDKNGNIVMGEDGKPVMMDALDSALADDFSGHEANLVHALAETERDELKVRTAKALFGGEGAGTDEHLMFEALDDAQYAEAYENATPEQRAAMAAKRKEDFKKRIGEMSGYDNMESLLDNDMGERGKVTYEDIEAGKKKDGSSITPYDLMNVNLEREVAQCKLERGKCPADLQLRYAVFGDGTDEKLIKDALSKGGDPLPKSEVAAIRAKYQKHWGRVLASHNELDVLDFVNFKSPSGDLNNDLSGDDWFDVRMLLCGKPETAEEMRYVSKARVAFKTSGAIGDGLMAGGEAIGFSDTRSDLIAQDKRFDALYESIPPEMRKAKLSELAKWMGEHRKAVGPDGKPLLGPDGKPLPDDVFERYCEYLQADADAYGAAKASFVDAIVTALEIIGGVLVSIATAGAASPVLAAIIANLVIAAGGIILKKAALGDSYGADRFFEDAAMALLSAGVAAAEAKAFSKMATTVANKVVKVEAVKAAEEAGMELAEGGLKVASKGREFLNKMIQSGVKTVLTESATTVGQTLMSEEFWNSKPFDALFGENSLCAKLMTGIPKAMASGMVRGALDDFNTSRKSYAGSALAGALTSAGANTAGILCYPDSYADATEFWNNLLKSNIQAIVSGGFDGVGGHKARAKNLGRDFVSGDESPEKLAEKASFLADSEKKIIAEAAHAAGKGDELPEAFKKFLPAKAAPADNAKPGPASSTNDPPPPPPPPPAHAHDDTPPPPPNDNGGGELSTKPKADVTPDQPADLPVKPHVDGEDPNKVVKPPVDGEDPNKVVVKPGDVTPANDNTTVKPPHEHAADVEQKLKAAKIPGTEKLTVVPDSDTPGPGKIRASDAERLHAAHAQMGSTESGKLALKRLEEAGVTFTFESGAGNFRQGNTINLDPKHMGGWDGTIVHEAHHAATFDAAVKGAKDKDEFVKNAIRNEAEAQAELILHNQQLGGETYTKGHDEFAAAYKAYKDANPDATPEQCKQAGIKALESFMATATPSTSKTKGGASGEDDDTYAAHYGREFDRIQGEGGDAVAPAVKPRKKTDAEWDKLIHEQDALGNEEKALELRRKRHEDQAAGKGIKPMPYDEWVQSVERAEANRLRGRKDEDEALKGLGIENNNFGKPQTVETDLGVSRPDGITDTHLVDVKSTTEDRVYFTEQLQIQAQAAANGDPPQKDGSKKPRKLAVVIVSDNPNIEPSGPLAASDHVDPILLKTSDGKVKQWDARKGKWGPVKGGGDVVSLVGGSAEVRDADDKPKGKRHASDDEKAEDAKSAQADLATAESKTKVKSPGMADDVDPDAEALAAINARTAEQIAARKAEVQRARAETAARDAALKAEVDGLTDGGGHVQKVFDHITLGAGFAGVANEMSHPNLGDNSMMIGGANPWDAATNRFGQPAGESELPGHKPGHGMKETVSNPDARFMLANEHAENVALNKNDAKIKTYNGMAGSPEPYDDSWPQFAKDAGAKIRIPVTSPPDPTVRYIYTKATDVAVGPGSPRKLPASVLDQATIDAMKANGALHNGDQSFNQDKIQPGQEVANFGGGASGAWGTEASSKNAGSVEWLARLPVPDERWPAATKAKYDGLKADMIAAKESGDPVKIKLAEDAIQEFTFKEAPGHGFLPRNYEPGGAFDPTLQSTEGGNISRKVVSGVTKIEYVPQVEGGPKRVKITTSDIGPDGQPVVIWKDVLILSIGQDPSAAGGPVQMAKKWAGQLVPIYGPEQADGFKPVVGIQSPDGTFRILGAAATPTDVSKLMDQSVMSVDEHQANLAKQAQTLPQDSKGVVGGFALAQKTITTANAALADTLGMTEAQQRRSAGLPDDPNGPNDDGPHHNGPHPNNDGPHDDGGGTAKNLGDFRGDARPEGVADLTPQHVTNSMSSNQRLIAPSGSQWDPKTNTITLPDGKKVRIQVGTPRDGSVASFDPEGDGFVITVSSRARDADVVRALAHEVAEIHTISDPKIVTDNNDDKPTVLTTHLVGRFAEMKVLFQQQDRARALGDHAELDRIQKDLNHLAEGIGIRHGDEGADIRQKLLQQHSPELFQRLVLSSIEGESRPVLGKQTTREDFEQHSEKRVETLSENLVGDHKDHVADVERAALNSEMRLEEARRVFDPVYSAEANAARKKGTPAQQKALMDGLDPINAAMNHPGLDPKARAQKLLAAIEELENNPNISDDMRKSIDFKSMKARAQEMAAASGGPMTVLDAKTGKVTLGEKIPGHETGEQLSMHDLFAAVDRANRGAAENGMATEYVVVIHDPVDGQARVEIVSRPRPQYRLDEVGGEDRPPMTKPGGSVVDVGVGRSGYGSERTSEEDLANGSLVLQTELPDHYIGAQRRRELGIADPAPVGGPGRLMVFGDLLTYGHVLAGEKGGLGIMYINNLSSFHPPKATPEQYLPAYEGIAKSLCSSAEKGARIEIMWDMKSERPEGDPRGAEGDRGHLRGDILAQVIQQLGTRKIKIETVNFGKEGNDGYDFSIDAAATNNPDPSKIAGFTPPRPEALVIITFLDDPPSGGQ